MYSTTLLRGEGGCRSDVSGYPEPGSPINQSQWTDEGLLMHRVHLWKGLHCCSSSSSTFPCLCVCLYVHYAFTSECPNVHFVSDPLHHFILMVDFTVTRVCARHMSDRRHCPTPLMKSHDALPDSSRKIWASGEN